VSGRWGQDPDGFPRTSPEGRPSRKPHLGAEASWRRAERLGSTNEMVGLRPCCEVPRRSAGAFRPRKPEPNSGFPAVWENGHTGCGPCHRRTHRAEPRGERLQGHAEVVTALTGVEALPSRKGDEGAPSRGQQRQGGQAVAGERTFSPRDGWGAPVATGLHRPWPTVAAIGDATAESGQDRKVGQPHRAPICPSGNADGKRELQK
jgi:hypothetical protein